MFAFLLSLVHAPPLLSLPPASMDASLEPATPANTLEADQEVENLSEWSPMATAIGLFALHCLEQEQVEEFLITEYGTCAERFLQWAQRAKRRRIT